MALNRFIELNVAMTKMPQFLFSEAQAGIPIPPLSYRPSRIRKADIVRAMEVGESRFFPGPCDVRSTWQALASYVGKQMGRTYTARTVEEDSRKGIRIWRTA